MILLAPQQDQAIAAVRAWLADPKGPQIFRLFGFAGTGKTTLAKLLAEMVKGTVLYATTLHSLTYLVEVDEITGEVAFKLNPESPLADAALLVVDEVSMVDEPLALDVLSFGRKVLVLGDPEQLPPVKGEGYFISAEPDFMLTEVHRQAAENPIIRMSMDIREGRPIRPGRYGESLVLPFEARKDRARMAELVLGADQVICGRNRTRVGMNDRVRQLRGLADPGDKSAPVVGDRLICLHNVHKEALLNGSMWAAESVELHETGEDRIPQWSMMVKSLDEPDRYPQRVGVFPHFFRGDEADLHWKVRRCSREFTFGWAITCHKAQGSQWDRPIIFDESRCFREHARNWIYTAITRAAESVTVVL